MKYISAVTRITTATDSSITRTIRNTIHPTAAWINYLLYPYAVVENYNSSCGVVKMLYSLPVQVGASGQPFSSSYSIEVLPSSSYRALSQEYVATLPLPLNHSRFALDVGGGPLAVAVHVLWCVSVVCKGGQDRERCRERVCMCFLDECVHVGCNYVLAVLCAVIHTTVTQWQAWFSNWTRAQGRK